MTELRNIERELDRFRLRSLAAAVFIFVCFGLLIARLVVLQVGRHDELSTRAEANRISVVPIVPQRGRILDRNGVVLATNYTAYTLEITPSRVDNLEQTINALASVVNIETRDRRRFKRLMEESKSFESLPIRTKLTDQEVARFLAQRFRFPGVELKARLFRYYPLGATASHLLGYIGRINQAEKEAMEDWPDDEQANYRGTEYIGKLGLEESYEKQLHGITGYEEVETAASGRPVRRLNTHPATPGDDLHLSIDVKLQDLVEKLYGNRRGALVAMDPRNGEVLAYVSKPTFDPNLFVDGIDYDNWKELNESIDKPLLNRALKGTYPPGSTFKPYMAMSALQTGKRSPDLVIQDNLQYTFGGHTFRSPSSDRAGPKDMRLAIITSSNVYFYSLAVEMGVDLIHDQLQPFGFGRKTGIDLDGEVTGVLPSTAWKRQAYKRPEQQKWYPGETVSLGIGQGYNSFTITQLATAISTLSTGGKRFEPRLVQGVEDPVTHQVETLSSKALDPLPLKPENVKIVLDAMTGVAEEGTSARVFANAGYVSGGKTGTAQAATFRSKEKYSPARVAEHLRDHSLYIAFAPRDNPRIALALIVENAGWGTTAAAPIARRVLDYVLLGKYPSEEDIALVAQGKAGPPVGTPRVAADVPLTASTPTELPPDVMLDPAALGGAPAASSVPPPPAAASGAAAQATSPASSARGFSNASRPLPPASAPAPAASHMPPPAPSRAPARDDERAVAPAPSRRSASAASGVSP